MLIRAESILCSSRAHGETGAVVRLFTADFGLVAVYVAGARGRTLRPLLVPGNVLAAQWTDRGDGRLASAKLELVTSRGPWLGEPLASAGLGWATGLTALALPEGQSAPALFAALSALLDAICHAPSARGWARALAAYETLVLRETGTARRGDDAALPPPEEPWPDLLARLDALGRALASRLLADRARDAMAARAVLVDRLRRIGA